MGGRADGQRSRQRPAEEAATQEGGSGWVAAEARASQWVRPTGLRKLGEAPLRLSRDQPSLPLFCLTGHVRFIDYEYAGYNYQAFDIGNHFNEFAGEGALLCGLCPRYPPYDRGPGLGVLVQGGPELGAWRLDSP